MNASFGRSQNGALARGMRARGPFRRRLMSRGDVKRTQCAARNRQLMRGGRS
jgi:hypothetical protein